MAIRPRYQVYRWCFGCGFIWPNLAEGERDGQKWCGCDSPQIMPPGVAIHGNVTIGKDVSICEPAEINGTGSGVTIGAGCDIAAYVVINVADSSDRCLGRSTEIKRAPIVLEDHVFVGSHCFIGGGVTIGHHSKVAAGTIIREPLIVPPYSLVKMGLIERSSGWACGPVVAEGVYA